MKRWQLGFQVLTVLEIAKDVSSHRTLLPSTRSTTNCFEALPNGSSSSGADTPFRRIGILPTSIVSRSRTRVTVPVRVVGVSLRWGCHETHESDCGSEVAQAGRRLRGYAAVEVPLATSVSLVLWSCRASLIILLLSGVDREAAFLQSGY